VEVNLWQTQNLFWEHAAITRLPNSVLPPEEQAA